MGDVIPIADGLSNALSGLNTDRDKAAYSFYGEPTLQPDELVNAYRGSWMARKIVDIPASIAAGTGAPGRLTKPPSPSSKQRKSA